MTVGSRCGRSSSVWNDVVAELRLTDKLSSVLGAPTAKALAEGLDLHTVEQLLRHYPRRYAARGQLTDLRSLELDEHVTVMARVQKCDKKSYQDKRTGRMVDRLEVTVTDGTGQLQLIFFKQGWRERELRVGRTGLFSGKITERPPARFRPRTRRGRCSNGGWRDSDSGLAQRITITRD